MHDSALADELLGVVTDLQLVNNRETQDRSPLMVMNFVSQLGANTHQVRQWQDDALSTKRKNHNLTLPPFNSSQSPLPNFT